MKKVWPGWQRGVREGQNIAQNGPCFWLWSPLEAPKWVRDPGDGLKSIRESWGDHLGSISGSWTHLGASWGLRSQKWGPYLAKFGPSLTPPANLVKKISSKMACTGVPHIVLHVLCSTRTSGGCFRPFEVRFRGIFWPFCLGDFFYINKGPKCPQIWFQRAHNTPQRCELNIKHVVLYVGHLYKPFWTKKVWPGWQEGVREGQNVAKNAPPTIIEMA